MGDGAVNAGVEDEHENEHEHEHEGMDGLIAIEVETRASRRATMHESSRALKDGF